MFISENSLFNNTFARVIFNIGINLIMKIIRIMKKKVFCMMVLCMGLFSSCDKEEIGFEKPIVPPIEEPSMSELPSIDDLIKVKIDDDIMATVGINDWRSIAYGNGRYVAVGGKAQGKAGYVTTSIDGETWSTPVIITNNPSNGSLDYLVSVIYGNGKFVAVGNADVNVNYTRVTTSTNGITWTTCTNVLSNDNTNYAQEIIFANGKFVLITSTEFITSTDATNWTRLSKFPNTAHSIACGDGKFVVGGNSGKIYTSTDGTTWTTFQMDNVGRNEHIYCVAYGNDIFNAISPKGVVYTSTDGITWTYKTTIKLPSSLDASWCEWSRLRFVNGLFIVVGGSPYKGQKMCAYSIDGANWTFIDELTGDGATNNDLCAVQ